jgi:glycerol-3-phosphate dehydrogenase
MGQSKNSKPGAIWYNWPGRGCHPDHVVSPDRFSSERPYDVAVIGAGVVGCAIAYELSQYRLRIIVIDQAFDVGEGTSKANSAIIHTGFDATPGSLESRLVNAASRQWPELAFKLKIPFAPVSALMLAFNFEQLSQLPKLKAKAFDNGVDDVRLVSADEAKQLEPNISSRVLGGLLIPRESIADPFTTSIAYAEVATTNGVDMLFGATVSRVDDPHQAIKTVVAGQGIRIAARYVVNASGFGSRALVESYHGERMDLNPRRGQFVVYDRDCAHLVGRILLPIPTEKTKGMLVTPTIFGNLLAGPTAEDLAADDVHATNTTMDGLRAVRESSIEMCPALAHHSVIASYAGLRCNCAQGSYWMRFNDGHTGIVTLSGIRSTGFTASISTAQYVVERMSRQCGLVLERNPAATDRRPETKWPGWWRRPFDDPQRIAANPDYGRVVCTCEHITQGEIRDALEAAAGTATLDGLKRRTRVLTGRCQGFHCCVPVAEMISDHFGFPLGSVTKRGPGSEFISGGQSVISVRSSAAPRSQALKSRCRVVIVGAGPAGIGVAVELAKRGIKDVLLVDRASKLGGIPAMYEAKPKGVPTFLVWTRGRVLFGQEFVNLLAHDLAGTTTRIALECQVVEASQENKSITVVGPHGKAEIRADAIVFACGARERTISERGWITGHRPARVFFTMQMLQLLDGCHVTPMVQPAIVGSDLIAYSAAAKLQAAGSKNVMMFDKRLHPMTGLLGRVYFRRWTQPTWQPAPDGIRISDHVGITQLEIGDDRHRRDGVVVSGELVPNSELAVVAGLHVNHLTRIPTRRARNELSAPGWFVAGSEIGGFHGAHWCYQDGRRAAASTTKYLRNH